MKYCIQVSIPLCVLPVQVRVGGFSEPGEVGDGYPSSHSTSNVAGERAEVEKGRVGHDVRSDGESMCCR